MTTETEQLLHRLADAKRQLDASPTRGGTSRTIIIEHYGNTVRRLASALIEEGYGKCK